MALINQERVGKAVELLRDGLKPFVERELQAVHGPKWADVADHCRTLKFASQGFEEA